MWVHLSADAVLLTLVRRRAETVDELTANASAADIVLEPAQLDALTALTVAPSELSARLQPR
jgi:transposase